MKQTGWGAYSVLWEGLLYRQDRRSDMPFFPSPLSEGRGLRRLRLCVSERLSRSWVRGAALAQASARAYGSLNPSPKLR